MSQFFGKFDVTKFEGISTVESIRTHCGWCDSIIAPNKGYEVYSHGIIIGYIYVCPNCHEIVLVNGNGEVFPKSKYGKQLHKLPDDIMEMYEECRNCFSIGAYTSIVLIARKLLMHLAVQNGAQEGLKFIEYVDYLDSNHFVPANSRNLYDCIRKQGNEATHEIVLKTKEEAEKILNFLFMILTFIYEFAD